MKIIKVRSIALIDLIDFLENRDYIVDEVSENILSANKSGEMTVYISLIDDVMYFYVDLGNISEIADKDLYFKILDLNTEILPVSIGIDTTNENNNRLVIVESREIDNLDDNELLYIFNAMEIATDKVAMILAEYLD
ncbi:MAG: hypothetical protein PF574_00495 [Candidatus Delongbacteria bacterium]|jgi:hypothetical protein|nr:hypothetical protein [Candidatus Delongbacteria bacterium]